MLVFRLDSAADLMSLHVGDRILEVNGRPVEDHCIDDIENLIVCSRDAVQVSFICIDLYDLEGSHFILHSFCLLLNFFFIISLF